MMATFRKYIALLACLSGLLIEYFMLRELFLNWFNPSLKCGTNWFGWTLGYVGIIFGVILILFGMNKLFDKRVTRIVGGVVLLLPIALLILFIIYPGCQNPHAR